MREKSLVRPVALAGVLIAAKFLGLVDRDLPSGVVVPLAIVWDDFAFAATLAAAEWLTGRAAWTAVIYWAAVGWAALNIPVSRALGSPLTTAMIGATGGPLADSIRHYVTVSNLAAIAAVIGLGVALPRWVARIPGKPRAIVAAAALAVMTIGAFAASRVTLAGVERNAFTSLVKSALPRVDGRALEGDWRASPFSAAPLDDLSRWRAAGAGRNVLLIALESTAARYLHLYGALDDPTPTLTALGAQAIVFDRAYAAYPESIKGLFAVLCSRMPAFDLSAETHARAACSPLAGAFKSAGYRSALFHSGRFRYLGMDDVVANQAFDTLEDAGAIGGRVESSFGVDEPSTVARMLNWIDRAGSAEPFFITYLPAAGHHPYATSEPGPFQGDGDRIAYKNALHEGDRALAVLVAGLRDRGLLERTTIVVFGDHGEAFGQHDGNFGHSLHIYDENIRVPLFVAMPGVTSSPTRVKNVASVIDIAPTLLDLTGLAIPAAYEGQSLLAARPRMALFFTDYSLGLLGLQDGCWKAQLEIESGHEQLFDTCADPDERSNVASAHPDRVAAYRERLRSATSATRHAISLEALVRPAAVP